MTEEQKAHLQALSDVRLWHRLQIGQALGDVRTLEPHEKAIAWLDEQITTKKQRAAEDEADRQRERAANS